MPCGAPIQDPFSGHRVDPAARQGRGHDRKIGHGDLDGTLTEVVLDGFLHRADQGTSGQTQVAQGPVAVPGLGLGAVHVLVDGQFTAGACRQHRADPLEPILTLDQRGRHDRARVDHRVGRTAVLVQADGVERLPTGFGADVVVDRVDPVLFHRDGVDERFGDRLHREGPLDVAGHITAPVSADRRDPEDVRVGVGQFGDVVRDPAIGQWADLGADPLEHGVDRVVLLDHEVTSFPLTTWSETHHTKTFSSGRPCAP